MQAITVAGWCLSMPCGPAHGQIGTCLNMCMGMHINMCVAMCIHLCKEMCSAGTCIDMCIGMCMAKLVTRWECLYTRTCLYTCV